MRFMFSSWLNAIYEATVVKFIIKFVNSKTEVPGFSVVLIHLLYLEPHLFVYQGSTLSILSLQICPIVNINLQKYLQHTWVCMCFYRKQHF